MDELAQRMEAQGYQHNAPIGAVSIDLQVCLDATCPACGHKGMTYEPYTKGDSYRAFAVCPVCGHEEEF